MERLKTKRPSTSATVKTEVVCPNDTNPMGILQGGRLVQWMDIAAAVSAQVHSGKICVTASINEISFKSPAMVGDIISIHARITRTFNTSMEVLVEAHAQKISKPKRQLIGSGYFTFVALNENKEATIVVPLLPVSKREKQEYEEALKRKKRLEK